MSAVLEARAIITAEDRTGKAFDSLKARIAGIQKVVEVMDRSMTTVGAVAKNVDVASASFARMGQAGRTVDTIAGAIGSVERASAAMATSLTRSSEAVKKLSGDLTGTKAKLAAIADFKGANRALDETSLAFRRGQQEVHRLQAEISGMANPTKSMHGALAGAQASTAAAAEAFKLQGAAAREARAALDQLGVPVNRLRAEEERLAASADTVSKALQKQVAIERDVATAAERTAAAEHRAAEVSSAAASKAARAHAKEAAAREAEIRHHGAMNFLAMGAAGAVSAHAVMEGIGETVHAGAEYHHEIVGLQNAGRTPEEIAAIERRSAEVVGKLPTASYLDNLKVIAETTGAFGSVEHAMDHLEFMQKTMSVLKASGGEHLKGSVGDVGRALAKTFEERMTKPEEFEREASAMIPAMVASGGTFNPEQLYAFAQQAKSALPSLSMRFLSRIAPSLIGAQGGQQAGTALGAFESVIAGKVNDKKQAEAFLHMGLLDPNMAIMKAGHAVGWQSGAIKDTRMAMRDPLEWAETYLIPAMQAKGIDTNDREAVQMVLNTMFRNRMANQFATEITQESSRARLHKDEALTNKAGSLDEINERNKSDPTVQILAVKTALGNLMTTLSNPMMGRAGLTLNSVAKGLDTLADTMKEHPALATSAGVMAAGGALAGAGYLSYQFMNGFGLDASATALTGSAGALDGAAARLGAAGLEHGFETAIPGAGGRVARTAERVVIREGEHLAEGAAEAAIGGKIVGAIEGGLKGGLSVAALEVATTAGVTLTAGTVAFLGLSAAAIIAGLVNSTPPKHHASDDPNFGKVLRPSTFDVTDPNLQDKTDEARKPWFNRKGGAHPRGSVQSQKDTDLPGHWVAGPHGTRHWALDAPRTLKDAPFYATLVGPDGKLSTMPRLGLAPDPSDPHTWAHISPNAPAPHPELYAPADVPLPPVLPSRAPAMPAPSPLTPALPPTASAAPPPMPSGGIPVHIVGTSVERMPTGPLGFGLHRDFTLGNNSGGFGSPGMGASDHFDPGPRRGAAALASMVDAHSVEPHVNDSELVALDTKLTELGQHAQAVGATPVSIKADASSVENMIALLTRAISLKAQLGGMPAGGGGTSGAVGTSYPQTAPTGRQGGPR